MDGFTDPFNFIQGRRMNLVTFSGYILSAGPGMVTMNKLALSSYGRDFFLKKIYIKFRLEWWTGGVYSPCLNERFLDVSLSLFEFKVGGSHTTLKRECFG